MCASCARFPVSPGVSSMTEAPLPVDRRTAERPHVRWDRQRAWAACIFVAGLLLFVWPFVRTPPLPIGLAYAHLLGAWLLVVIALYLMARSIRPEPRRRGRDG